MKNSEKSCPSEGNKGSTRELRFPPWLKKRIPARGEREHVMSLLEGLRLHTVCQSAKCPNMAECFSHGVATFMIMGNTCTRNCGFCAVRHGVPEPLDPEEPRLVAEAALELHLRHVVVTSVTRDDIADGGASHFAATIRAIKERGDCRVEVLTPDFQGKKDDIETVAAAGPAVFNHNVETVPRLYPRVRPQADYGRSLMLIEYINSHHPTMFTKSGIMVGIGESRREIRAVLKDLRCAGCDALTIGQYLRPSPEQLPVSRFVPPDEFEELEEEAKGIGFEAVASGPFVRSSYEAASMYDEGNVRSEAATMGNEG